MIDNQLLDDDQQILSFQLHSEFKFDTLQRKSDILVFKGLNNDLFHSTLIYFISKDVFKERETTYCRFSANLKAREKSLNLRDIVFFLRSRLLL